MSKIDLHFTYASGPCRTVLLTAAAVGIELNLKMTDVMGGEHLKPAFLKMNPLHTIPTMDDNGYYLWESRAIAVYLADKYAKNDTLYPKEPKARGLVNQALCFDMGTLYASFSEYFSPMIFANAPDDPAKFEKVKKAYESFETLLDGKQYIAGKYLTVGDLALVSTVATFEVMGFDLSPYKNVVRWFNTIKAEAPQYEETNGRGAKEFKQLADSLKK